MTSARTAVPSILVTGAAGFVGIPTVRELLNRGCSVAALDDFRTGDAARLRQLQGEGELAIFEVDLTDPRAVRDTIGGQSFAAVLHLAALHFIPYCVAHPAETLAVNVLGTQHLLDCLLVTPPSRLLFVSTGDVYAAANEAHHEDDTVSPTNVYGQSKLMGEWLVRAFGERAPDCAVVIARLFNVFGPAETNPHVLPDILDYMRHGDNLALGNTETRRDYIFVDDVARIFVDLVTTSSCPTVVNVGAGDAATVTELVCLLRSITGRQLKIKTDPGKFRRSDRPVLEADISRLTNVLPELELTPRLDALEATLASEGFLDRVPAELP